MHSDFSTPIHQRRTLIISYLQELKTVTRRELANLYGCSLKTIQRDIETLRNDRWPIESDSEGYFLRIPSSAERKTTNNKHLAVVALAGCSIDRNLKHIAPELAMGIKREFFKMEDIAHTWTMDRQATDLKSISFDDDDLENFGKLARYILNQQSVSFFYIPLGKDQGMCREVFPIQLKERNGHWYLMAYDFNRKQDRVFAHSRKAKDVTRT